MCSMHGFIKLKHVYQKNTHETPHFLFTDSCLQKICLNSVNLLCGVLNCISYSEKKHQDKVLLAKIFNSVRPLIPVISHRNYKFILYNICIHIYKPI